MPTIGPAADFFYYKGGQRTEEVQPARLLQVYDRHTPQTDAAIIEFWKAQEALPRQDDDFVLQRLSEVLFVVVNDQYDVVGVCSGIPTYFEQIRKHFLYFRVFVRPDWRGLNRGVASGLFYATFDLFDELRALNGQPIIGVLTVYESRHLNGVVDFYHSAQHRNQVFIGWTPRDEQIRVSYFNNVRMF